MTGHIAVINAGSSSVKFAIYPAATDADGGEPAAMVRGQVAGLGVEPRLTAQAADGRDLAASRAVPGAKADHAEAIAAIVADLADWVPGSRLLGAGHRVTHGGSEFDRPVVLTPAILARLETLAPLAPQHQPHNIAAIRALAAHAPDAVQVACFDTQFHATQPAVARLTGLPRAYHERGLRRYGFHGLSYEYVTGAFARIAGEPLPERTVVAHLGNGCSLAAVLGGKSIATTMGFSTLDGVPMATRSGAIDPGLLLHLLRTEAMDIGSLQYLLYDRSGLLGISGISSDMKTLLASPEPASKEAIEFFGYRIAREFGSLAVALGGLDAVVFTGGIGEKAAPVRADICARLAWLGLDFDADANARAGTRISRGDSRVSAWVVPTDEESVIARHTLRLMAAR
ncbi:MAG: acetate/propionate family kinase [Rhodospirillales bacterium]|nr:acetate/propionate family kinase [Rhodospirillales bacterium]